MTILCFLYALVCNSSLEMLNCTGPGFALASNPAIKCSAGDHLPVGVLAVAALLLHIIGFPAVTFFYLRGQLGRLTFATPSWRATWAFFLYQDYNVGQFWVNHMNLAVQFGLSILLVFVPAGSSLKAEIAVFVLTAVVTLVPIVVLVKVSPYVPTKKWKLPVKCLALALSCWSALASLVAILCHPHSSTQAVSDAFGYSVLGFAALLVCVFLFQFRRVLLILPISTGNVDQASFPLKSRTAKHESPGVNLLANPMLRMTRLAQKSEAAAKKAVPVVGEPKPLRHAYALAYATKIEKPQRLPHLRIQSKLDLAAALPSMVRRDFDDALV